MSVRKRDEERGTLRLILILAYDQVPLTRLEYMKEADEVGVGRMAFYSGIRTLMMLGLVEETSETRMGKRVILSGLTKDGWAVAKLLIEIEEMLGDGGSTRQA
jgi:hypothetical protein